MSLFFFSTEYFTNGFIKVEGLKFIKLYIWLIHKNLHYWKGVLQCMNNGSCC